MEAEVIETAGRFRKLRVWQEGVELARAVFTVTAAFPGEERFGLGAQLRRAAVSVPSNIAEGSVRRSRKEFGRYVEIALGSLAEVETQIEIGNDLINAESRVDMEQRITRTRRMLYRLLAALR
jgi:four helix bundle protein